MITEMWITILYFLALYVAACFLQRIIGECSK